MIQVVNLLQLLESWVRQTGGVWLTIIFLGLLLLGLNQRWYHSRRRFQGGFVGRALLWSRAAWQRLIQPDRRRLLLYVLLLVVSGWAVGVLLDDWVQREPELFWRDQLANKWLRLGAEETSPWLLGIAWLGDVRLLTIVALITAVWQWRSNHRTLTELTFVNYFGALSLGWGLQWWLKRPLPLSPEHLWQLTSYAFPNLPSLMAVAVYGWLGYLWQRERIWHSRLNAGTLAVFVSLSVAIANLYLAQAQLSDVLAGLALGTLWMLIPTALTDPEVVTRARHVRAKTTRMPPKQRLRLLLALTIPVIVLTFISPPIAQDPSYHNFADQRMIWGIPNFFNVTSNAPFLLFGGMGLLFLWRLRASQGWPAFAALLEERPYWVFFFGVAITSIGSSYYHWAPSNTHLVWDRLPMTFGFMSLFAAIIMERIDRDAGLRLLTPLVIIGVSSVAYWYLSELHNRGDLRMYIDVQFYPLIAIPLIAYLFQSRYTKGGEIYNVMLLYAVAKAFELLDVPVFQFTGGFVSGHTIKHLFAALATYWVLYMISRRQVASSVSIAPIATG